MLNSWIFTTDRGLAFQMARDHFWAGMWWPPQEILCFFGDLVSIATGRVHYDDSEWTPWVLAGLLFLPTAYGLGYLIGKAI